jgi:hypothetical protein
MTHLVLMFFLYEKKNRNEGSVQTIFFDIVLSRFSKDMLYSFIERTKTVDEKNFM